VIIQYIVYEQQLLASDNCVASFVLKWIVTIGI